jgi:tetratricopeptide (TPR) repeat protein
MRSLLAAVLLFSASTIWAAEENASGKNAMEAAGREFQQRKFDAALATLNDAEKRGDPTAKSFILKGRIYAEQQKYDDALFAFDAAYKLEPASLARLYLADMFVAQKKWDEARALYESAMKETNVLIAHERLRYGLLIALLGAKDDDGSRAAVERLPFPTESAAYYYAQAAWAFAHGTKSDGDKWIRRAEEIFPTKSTAWFARPLFDLGWIKTRPPLVAD